MDIEYFLKKRTTFIRYFYEKASEPFFETMIAIENEKEPYIPPYSEDPDPPFLDEFMDASTGMDTVGHTAISMLSSALQLFLKAWVDRFDRSHGMKFEVDFKKNGWINGYKEIFLQWEMDISACPASFDIVEQVTLARNRVQHPEELTMIPISHSKIDLKKYPRPFFIQNSERLLVEEEGDATSWLFPPMLSPSKEKVFEAISEVEKLCEWLDIEYWKARSA